MTLGNIVFGPQFKEMDKFFVGFDDTFRRINQLAGDYDKSGSNYPPYNIKKTGDTTYVVELAVAGFSKDDIEIELNDGKLNISGRIGVKDSDKDETHEASANEPVYLFKGIADRAFTRSFALDEQVEVVNADLRNGMLIINLEKIVPEHRKPRLIPISTGNEFISEPQLLVEDAVEA